MAGAAALTFNWVALLLVLFLPIFSVASPTLGVMDAGDKEEIEKLLNQVGEKHKNAIKTEVEAAVKGLMTGDDFATKMEAFGIKDGVIKELTEALTKQGEELRKFFDAKGEHKSIEELIKDKATEIKALATTNDKRETVKLILPGQHKTQVTRASVGGSTMAMRLTDVGQLPFLGTVMTNQWTHARVSASSNGVIRYYDQNAITRNAATVAEGATKPESAITWIERLLPIQKIADSIPVTKEAFNDVYFIESEIRRLLDVNLALKEDQQLYAGDGVAPNLVGLITTAPTFDSAAYAASTKYKAADANLFDLIAILRVEIMNSKQSKYAPNKVLLNPADILRYKLAKGVDGHYILPAFISSDGSTIDTMQVIETSQVVANTLVLGDFRYGTIYDLEDVTVEMGWINDQFIKNAMTILAEKREALLIRNVDADAYLKVTNITTAITAITAP